VKPSRVRISTSAGDFEALRAGSGPLVLVLHGFPDHPPTSAPFVARLAAAGFDVVAPWLRGYAPSVAHGPYDPAQLAKDVLAIAAALRADGRAFLVGHDWGAVATYVACEQSPDRVIAAVTMAVPHPRAFLRSFVRTAQLARSWYMFAFQLPGALRWTAARDLALVDLLWRRWSPGFALDPAAREELRACLRASWPAPVVYYRDAARAARANGGTIGAIAVPTLQLQGARDGCIAPSACAGQARGFSGPFREEVVPSVGHFLHVEDPDGVAARVIDWLRQSLADQRGVRA
jgi:pimeloyl-ACP methyl ester carboxylesterase